MARARPAERTTWRSRALAHRRATLRGDSANSAHGSSRHPRNPHQPLAGPPLDPAPYDLVCLTSPNGVEGFRATRAIRPRARALAGARSPRSGRAPREPCGSTASRLTSSPSALSPSPWSRRSPTCPSHALIARARRPAMCCPTRCAQRGIEVDVLALYETVAEPLPERALAAAWQPTTSPSPRPQPCASSWRQPG